MVNGDHEQMGAEEQADSAADDQLFSTQDDGRNNANDENLPTQIVARREIQALLRFRQSQPAQPQQEVRLTLPDLGSSYLINLGRLISNEPNSVKYQQLVRLYDKSRPPDKQIISREHSQLLIRQTAPACFTVSLKDTKDHDRRSTVITSPTGDRRVVTHDSFMPLSHGDIIHLSPLAPPIQEDHGILQDYQSFRLELDFLEARPPVRADSDVDDISHSHSLKMLVPSSKIGRLMGMGGSIIRKLKQDFECELETSPWGSFHPCAPSHYQGRTVQCSAKTCCRLSQCCAAVLQAIFAEDQGTHLLRIALPASSAGALDARISSIAGATGATLHWRSGAPEFEDERLLECTGTLEALTKLLPQLLVTLDFPLPYRWGTHYGAPTKALAGSRPDIDLPLETVISRSAVRGFRPLPSKRKAEREAYGDAKRAQPAHWRPNRGPGAGVRGRGSRH